VVILRSEGPGHMRKSLWRHGPMAAMVMGVGMAVALGGCGGGAERTTSNRLSAGAAGKNSKVAACLERNGGRGVTDRELRVANTAIAAERKAVEQRCGFEVAKAAQPGKKARRRALAKQPQSFRSRAIARVVACLHRAGVGIGSSDSDLLSSTSGIKTRSPQVKAAIGKCRIESMADASR
jgi:hypothetical protein